MMLVFKSRWRFVVICLEYKCLYLVWAWPKSISPKPIRFSFVSRVSRSHIKGKSVFLLERTCYSCREKVRHQKERGCS